MTEQNRLVEMKEREYDNESILQDILARFPTLLLDYDEASCGRRLLLVKREMEIPSDQDETSRWSADHLFINQEGVPIIVEVKRNTDTRIRREVVGQMLDYAANGIIYWPLANLQEKFRSNCEKEGVNCNERMAEFLGENADEDAFWEKVKTNLQAGKIRMIFVADSIPKELRKVVEFLNEQMDPAEVLAIEVKQYQEGGHRAFVPSWIGQTEEASVRKSPTRRSGKTVSMIMEEATDNAKELFTALFDLHGKDGLLAGPDQGSATGFHVNVRLGNHEIPVCWGYTNSDGPKESVIIKFSKMDGVNDSQSIIMEYRAKFLNTGFFQPSGSKDEVKTVFDRNITKKDSEMIIELIKDLGREIVNKGNKEGGE